MSVTWDIVQRAVILRGGELKADSASSLSTLYATADIDQTDLDDRAIEFPFLAINDAILNAASHMVKLIGLDVESPYRSYFAGVTSSIATGATIPTVSSTSKPVMGVIGDVKDASTSKRCTAAPYEAVIRLTNISAYFGTAPHHYYTDNTRIWHTRTNVVADVVMWSETDQRALMVTTPARGTCPFPDDLLPTLVEGSLSFLFKGQFNMDQAEYHRQRWNEMLASSGLKTPTQERIATQ